MPAPFDHIGCYYPDPAFAVARTLGNFVVVWEGTERDPAKVQALLDSGLQIVLNMHVTGDLLLYGHNSYHWPAVVDIYERWGRARLPPPLGILIGDEMFAHLRLGHFSAGPMAWPELAGVTITPHIIDLFSQGLSRYVRALRTLWPHTLYGSVDHVWTNDQRWVYSPMPDEYDFCALDVYHWDPGSPQHQQDIARIYRDAWQTFRRPILAVPQAFWQPDIPEYSQPLTWDRLRRQLQIIEAQDGVGGLCYFACDLSFTPTMQGLMQHTEVLELAVAYGGDRT